MLDVAVGNQSWVWFVVFIFCSLHYILVCYYRPVGCLPSELKESDIGNTSDF